MDMPYDRYVLVLFAEHFFAQNVFKGKNAGSLQIEKKRKTLRQFHEKPAAAASNLFLFLYDNKYCSNCIIWNLVRSQQTNPIFYPRYRHPRNLLRTDPLFMGKTYQRIHPRKNLQTAHVICLHRQAFSVCIQTS